MNKWINRLLIVVILLSAVAIVVIGAPILFGSKGGDAGDDRPPLDVSDTGTPPPSQPASSPPSHEGTVQSDNPEESAPPTDAASALPAAGTVKEIFLPDSAKKLYITVNEDIFDFTDDGAVAIIDKSVSNRSVYLEIVHKQGRRAADIAPSFMEAFMPGASVEYSEAGHVGKIEARCEKVIAQDGAVEMQAWLFDRDGWAEVVIISYTLADKDAQLERLLAMLGTLEMK